MFSDLCAGALMAGLVSKPRCSHTYELFAVRKVRTYYGQRGGYRRASPGEYTHYEGITPYIAFFSSFSIRMFEQRNFPL